MYAAHSLQGGHRTAVLGDGGDVLAYLHLYALWATSQ